MTESARAVFLSYASEDAQAARSICEALRAAGIEVWFDQSELRGGAVWDKQIRRQIHDCALFVPIISARAQARLEGYFRREWKLAADRTNDMAEEKPFLVPVVIDGTSERHASVPDRFRDVQWTFLAGGHTSAAFIERVKRLLEANEHAATSGTSPEHHRNATPEAVIPRAATELPLAAVRSAPASDRLHELTPRSHSVRLAAAVAAAILAAVAIALLGHLRQSSDRDWRDPLTNATVTRLTGFDGSAQAAALSQDGRLLAFLAERDEQSDIWVTEIGTNRYRDLTQGHLQQLNNPEIRSVAFSPDSSLVTFWTRNGEGTRAEDVKVMAAPTAGGPLQEYLQDAAEFDWSRDGTRLVFHTTAPGDPLFVRAEGDATAHEIYVAPPGIHCHFPTWSPDGEYIYFVRGEPPSQDWDVWRLRPSGADAERLTFHDAMVSYPVLLDSRTLIYLATDADGSGPWLYAMDLAVKREHRIGFGLERYLSLAASANGKRMVATVADSHSELWRATIPSIGPPQTSAEPVSSALGAASAPRFGPGYIAYVSSGAGQRGIWKFTDGTSTKLWVDPTADRIGAPAIAPDGRRIAFTVERHAETQLYVVDSDGGNPRAITPTFALRGDLAWTPDSQSLVGAIVSNGELRLAKIFLDGTAPQPMVAEYSRDPVWSRDGNYFVYAGAQVGTTFPLRAAAADGRPYAMPSLFLTRGAGRVAFARKPGSLVILRGPIGHMNFWLSDLQTGAERQLTDLPAGFVTGDFDLSPDGSEIVFSRVKESSSIALIDLER